MLCDSAGAIQKGTATFRWQFLDNRQRCLIGGKQYPVSYISPLRCQGDPFHTPVGYIESANNPTIII